MLKFFLFFHFQKKRQHVFIKTFKQLGFFSLKKIYILTFMTNVHENAAGRTEIGKPHDGRPLLGLETKQRALLVPDSS